MVLGFTFKNLTFAKGAYVTKFCSIKLEAPSISVKYELMSPPVQDSATESLRLFFNKIPLRFWKTSSITIKPNI